MRKLFLLKDEGRLLMASLDKGLAEHMAAERLSMGLDATIEEHSEVPDGLLEGVGLEDLMQLERDGAIFF
jgi:hypothetical protein